MRTLFLFLCRHISCADASCALCAQSQYRQCKRNFQGKYLVGDPLRAECGAVIRIEIIDDNTGEAVKSDTTLGIRLDAVVLNGKALENYAGLQLTDSDVEQLSLTRNSRGGPLLTLASGSSYDDSGRLSLPLRSSEVILSDLRVTASSEAMLQGQRPQFTILIRALDSNTGKRIDSIPLLLSEG